MRRQAMAAAMGVMAVFGAPEKAQAYDIDCAIMLCMAGGFPPSAVCARAYRTMIRRITPWPSLPPFGVCTFAHVPVELGGPGGEGELDTNLPEYEWLKSDPCDLVHRALLRAARRAATVGLVDPLLRSRESDLQLHPAGLRIPHALARDIHLGKRSGDRLSKRRWPLVLLFPQHHGRIRRLRGQHAPLGVVLLLIVAVRKLE